jgi:hypothetical protein
MNTSDEERLNQMGVLTRREIEARILAPILEALSKEIGRERVLEIAREVIVEVARKQGKSLADSMQGNSLAHFDASMDAWKKGDAIQVEVLERSDKRFGFNVTRCKYAEMYRELGIPELGSILSCSRDFSLIEGFNPDVELTRTQTLMEGSEFCDFRYEIKDKE